MDDELKKDFFNCYKFDNDSQISDSQSYPKSIIGVRNYDENIRLFWEKYKQFIMDKYDVY